MATMRPIVGVWVAVMVAACRDSTSAAPAAAWSRVGENTGSVAGPPLTVGPATSTSIPPPPPVAAFRELTAGGIDLPFAACHEVLVTPVTDSATVGAEQLAQGDVLSVRGEPESHEKLVGRGLALVVTAQDVGCVTRTRVVRASKARELTFLNGAMHAHLDVDDRDVASFYLGRLSGTSGVPEHAHDPSWEILCAVEAAGTFTLDGKESRLGPSTCVSVPPGAKHSWTPDPDSNLVAVQIYSPAGPEQRFKKLASDEWARDH
jgi:mannose-6-phosphate isomerase-like protein (cupin superfamily)